jgi:hypothetical protein
MGFLKFIKEYLEKQGITIIINRPWPGEKDLPKPKHPSQLDGSDAIDEVMKSLDKKYTCCDCDNNVKLKFMCKCKDCGKLVCKSCYTLVNKKAWCKQCLKRRKSKKKSK